MEEGYSQFVKLMYDKGYYVSRYTINLMSYEVYFADNKIFILPAQRIDEDTEYVFTGTHQKTNGSTTFKLLLWDNNDKEFDDDDNIMISLVDITKGIEKSYNLYTRNYATWKFGINFRKGVMLNKDKYLIIRAQKLIGRFDIDITNIDLFSNRYKLVEEVVENEKMLWLD